MLLDNSVNTVIRLRAGRRENCPVETGAEISLLFEDPMPAHEILSPNPTDKNSQCTKLIRHFDILSRLRTRGCLPPLAHTSKCRFV